MNALRNAPRHEREVEAARTRAERADPFAEGGAAARARKLRSSAIALGLVFLVLLIFGVSLVRLGLSVHPAASRPSPQPASRVSTPAAPAPASAPAR